MLRRRAKHPWRPVVALGVVLALLSGVGGGAYLAYSSVSHSANELQAQLTSHLEAGQRELEAAKTDLKQANASHDEKLIDQAKVHFLTAKLQFLTAAEIADNSEVLRRLEGVPSVGKLARSRHAAVDSVSEMGIQLALAGQDLADLDGQLIKPAATGQQGQGLLTVVNQVQAKIGSVRGELKAALMAADSVDMSVLPSSQRATFVKARGTISQGLGAIDQFQALVPILIETLGGNGPRTYLIEQVNPAELRPGGGFIGTYSVLRADHGSLSLVKSGNATDFIFPRALVGEPGYLQPPGPIREFVPLSWSFIDSNFFPDFTSNAQAAETFVQPRLGQHIDAVISIDYYVVAKLLQLTGPIAVPGYRLTLTADNFVPIVVQYDVQSATDPASDEIHKAILAAVAGPLLQRVVTLQPSQWPALLGSLNDLAASRHLQAYFNNGDVEKTIDQYGWSGVQRPAAARDYVMEVEANLGGTKANYFVTRNYTIELTRNAGTLHHKLTIDIADSMDFSYRPGEYYKAYIRMYVADKSSATSIRGSPPVWRPRYPDPPPPPGTHMIDCWMLIHGYGHHEVVVAEWDTPWQPDGRGQEQIYWQKQPGTLNDKVDVIWHDGNGHTYKVSGDLGQDRVITVAPSAVTLVQGQVGTAQLPSLSLG